MKCLSIKVLGSMVLIALLSFAIAPTIMAQSQTSTTPDKALSFIANVLKLDMTKYNVSLANYNIACSDTNKPDLETVEYKIQTPDGNTGTIALMLSNGTMLFCSTTESEISSFTYAIASPNIVGAAKEIMQRYQLFCEDAAVTEMISALDEVNSVSNTTIKLGNTKLEITTACDSTKLWWKHTINGLDYNEIQIIFLSNGLIFSDYHSRTKIGGTDVKISQAQAIATACDCVNKYSYTAIGGPEGNETKVQISGFNIDKERALATIGPGERDNLLYPCWMVEVYLGNTYPGNVYGFRVDIWADSGQVLSISPLAVGGYTPVTHDDESLQEAGAIPSPATDSIAAIAVMAIITLLVVIAVLAVKKK